MCIRDRPPPPKAKDTPAVPIQAPALPVGSRSVGLDPKAEAAEAKARLGRRRPTAIVTDILDDDVVEPALPDPADGGEQVADETPASVVEAR
eukprot:6617649-Alexandrium_andersonii.AAC.1